MAAIEPLCVGVPDARKVDLGLDISDGASVAAAEDALAANGELLREAAMADARAVGEDTEVIGCSGFTGTLGGGTMIGLCWSCMAAKMAFVSNC